MDNKAKIKAGAVVAVVLIAVWQVIGLFGGDESGGAPAASPPSIPASGAPGAPGPAAPPGMPAAPGSALPGAPSTPGAPGDNALSNVKPGTIPSSVTPAEQAEMLRLQQEVQKQYVSGVSQLQLLKLSKEIADANKEIAASKLELIKTQKEIVNTLGGFDSGSAVVGRTGGANPPGPSSQSTPPPMPMAAGYVVVSVANLQGTWNAVLNASGKLYSVKVGDKLPPDGSIVQSINRSSVLLENNGEIRKVTVTPAI